MASYIRKLRGTAEDLLKNFIPAKVPAAVLAVNTDNYDLHVSDGKTPGGLPIMARVQEALQQYVDTKIKEALLNVTSIPAGTVAAFAMNSVPAGWLKCNGAWVSRTTYATLYGLLGNIYGTDAAGVNFKLPDLRGEFVRGFIDDRTDVTVETGRKIGTYEADALRSHQHSGTSDYVPAHNHKSPLKNKTTNGGGMWVVATELAYGDDFYVENNGGHNVYFTTNSGNASSAIIFTTETRPRNVALLYCIKT